jgi:CubicO group peptidase (beta-lactamase class C family)
MAMNGKRHCTMGTALLAFVCAAGAQGQEPPSLAQAVLAPYVERGEIAGGVIMVVDADEVLEDDATGFADLASRRPMAKDAVFWLASTYKPFFASALMMLVDEGRIDLDAPIRRYLPGFDPPVGAFDADGRVTATHPPARPVTVRMLLSHTGGINPNAPPQRDGPPPPTLAEMAASYAQAPLLFEPGTRFSYSNASIDTAARIVEVVAGMPFELFLKTRLLEPLGMTETQFCLPAAERLRLPVAYYVPDGENELTPIPPGYYDYALSDACEEERALPAMFSTAHDLARFARMLLNGGMLDGRRYLTAAAVDEMTRNQLAKDVQQTVAGSGAPDYISYGLGWGASLDGSYFHPGVGMTDIRVDATHRIATILLLQSTSPASFPARAAILKASDARYAHGSR